ncbi:hypothetical protein EYF80_063254 [Liparis tanakae]|uniref:Uncharacterized protein n=1 Tax=Liparis tanakae TaxID=230148 RepID=A0A4Z2ECZ7_9TELE|nr:hypothetical protein EYF80_063254 [Liparis tanakae]
MIHHPWRTEAPPEPQTFRVLLLRRSVAFPRRRLGTPPRRRGASAEPFDSRPLSLITKRLSRISLKHHGEAERQTERRPAAAAARCAASCRRRAAAPPASQTDTFTFTE